ncbi:MAG: hypothetical protein HY666_03630 [Chloroflexi bacterium]|nr:hypothetical protein [Chloroflexota bacterium]
MAFYTSVSRQVPWVMAGRGEGVHSWIRRVWVEGLVLLAFCGAILATNYALTSLPNVKIFDLMVFVAGYTLGFRRGAAVAAGAWLVYGTFNPWGATSPALLVTVILSELVYALAGAFFRRLIAPDKLPLRPGLHTIALVAVAVASTLAYDISTNIYTGISWAQFARSSDYGRWIVIAIFNPGALWFSGVHVGSNILFFSLLAPLLVRVIVKARRTHG